MATRIDRLPRLARGMLQALMVGLAMARRHRRENAGRGLRRPVVVAFARHGHCVVVVVVVVELGPLVVVDDVLELLEFGLLDPLADVSEGGVDDGELDDTEPLEDIEAVVEVSGDGDGVEPGDDVSVEVVVVDGLTATVVVDPGVALVPELL
jgi:hypothetical protein